MTINVRLTETDLLEWAGLDPTIAPDKGAIYFLCDVADLGAWMTSRQDAEWDAIDKVSRMRNHRRWELFVQFHLEEMDDEPVTHAVVEERLNRAATTLALAVWDAVNNDKDEFLDRDDVGV